MGYKHGLTLHFIVQHCAKVTQMKFDKICEFRGLSVQMNEISFRTKLRRTFIENRKPIVSVNAKFLLASKNVQMKFRGAL